MLRSIVVTLLAVGIAAAPLSAQARSGVPERTQTITISPILALFEIVQAEYERKLGEELTGAVGLGYWSFGNTGTDEFGNEIDDEVSWLAVDLKGRFYPRHAFESFSIGGIVGLARIGYRDDVTNTKESATGFAFGVDLNHSWLLGDTNRWYLAVGIGAKRYYFSEIDDDIPLILPTGRIGFGLAF